MQKRSDTYVSSGSETMIHYYTALYKGMSQYHKISSIIATFRNIPTIHWSVSDVGRLMHLFYRSEDTVQ